MHGHDGWHLLLEGVAAVVLVVAGALVLAAAAWRAWPDAAGRRGRRPLTVPAGAAGVHARGHRPTIRIEGVPPRVSLTTEAAVRALLAALSLSAGAVHLAAAPGHLAELGPVGAGFLVAGLLQVAWAGLAVRGHPLVRRTGLALHGALLVAWYVSRTSGLPVGPHPGIPEPIGVGDLVAAGAAGLIALALVWGVGSRSAASHREDGRVRPAPAALLPLLVPVLGVLFLVTVRAVGDVSGPGHHAADAPSSGIEHAHGPSGRSPAAPPGG